MTVGKEKIQTQFFGECPVIKFPEQRERMRANDDAIQGSPSVATRNAFDLPLANFTVLAGDNRLSRPVGGGSVESGFLRGGDVEHTNLTLDTETGEWEIIGFDQMYIQTS